MQTTQYTDTAVTKSGPLEKFVTSAFSRKGKWRLYTFTIENETHLKYFKLEVREVDSVGIHHQLASYILGYVFYWLLYYCCTDKKATGRDSPDRCD